MGSNNQFNTQADSGKKESSINSTQKITPCLWFDSNAEEAVNFYVSIFKNSKINSVNYYGVDGPLKAGTVLTITFELDGTEFTALNGGPHFKFSEAISFVVNCDTQEEIDMFWDKLSENGEIQMCGWLKDRYGLSWQIVPGFLEEMLKGDDQEKTDKVMKAILQMKKLDIGILKSAYEE